MKDEFRQQWPYLKVRLLLGALLGLLGGLETGAVVGLWVGSATFGLIAGSAACLALGICGFYGFEILDKVLDSLDDLAVKLWHRSR